MVRMVRRAHPGTGRADLAVDHERVQRRDLSAGGPQPRAEVGTDFARGVLDDDARRPREERIRDRTAERCDPRRAVRAADPQDIDGRRVRPVKGDRRHPGCNALQHRAGA